MLKDVYIDGWYDLQGMLEDFKISEKEVEGFNVIVAAYDLSGAYSGDAFVLLEKDGKYYEVNGGHCSCYGLEGQWQLEDSAEEALKFRYDSEYSYGGFSIAKETLKQHFGW